MFSVSSGIIQQKACSALVTHQLCEAHKGNTDFLCAHLTPGRRAHTASSLPSLCDDALLKQAAMLLGAVDSESMNNKTGIKVQLNHR